MEEILYNIEIHKNEGNFLGKLYSDIDGVKEFENNRIDQLLRDIIIDMQMALDEFSNRSLEVVEGLEGTKHFY